MVPKICSVEGCDNGGKLVRGWCDMHYSRWRRHGGLERVQAPPHEGPCAVEGCAKDAERRGWCSAHYQRWKRLGDPLGAWTRYETPEESIAARAERQGDCLIWTGATDAKGYGSISHNGVVESVHRFSYRKSVGPIPEEMEIDHLCQNPSCLEPSHLEAVTPAENKRRVGTRRSTCRNGKHPWIPENYYEYSGRRTCKLCRAESAKRRYWKHKLQVA